MPRSSKCSLSVRSFDQSLICKSRYLFRAIQPNNIYSAKPVGIVTGYGLDGRVWFPAGRTFFSSWQRPHRFWGPPNLLSPRVKRLGRETDHSHPTNADIKNSSCVFMTWSLMITLSLTANDMSWFFLLKMYSSGIRQYSKTGLGLWGEGHSVRLGRQLATSLSWGQWLEMSLGNCWLHFSVAWKASTSRFLDGLTWTCLSVRKPVLLPVFH
jgi:hypothetical protein